MKSEELLCRAVTIDGEIVEGWYFYNRGNHLMAVRKGEYKDQFVAIQKLLERIENGTLKTD